MLDTEQRSGRLALRTQLHHLLADVESPIHELTLDAGLGRHRGGNPGVGLLEDARGGTHEGGLDDGQVVDDLVDLAVDRGREAHLQRQGEQDLAEHVGQRQPEELQVVLVEDPDGVDGRRFIDNRVVGQLGALGAPGRSRGVDDDGQVVGRDEIDPLVDHRRAGLTGIAAQRLEVGQRDHPVVALFVATVRLTVEDDDLDDVGHVVTVRPQLLDLAVVLGEHEPRPGVTQDVGDILGHRCGVDRRRRTARTHDAEVGQGPLVARGRGDRHPVLDG
ncbi:MAG: hypothetical protein BWY91_02602 [bacterium ADurb.BinA028]|nr:MAG: hypothetical protein BWY91_02602 [bacterium ADurb.BinA028]